MKKSELKHLINEVIEEQQMERDMRRLNESIKDFAIKKALPIVLKPIINAAVKANPQLKTDLAKMTEKDFIRIANDPKIISGAKQKAQELASKLEPVVKESSYRLNEMDSIGRLLDKMVGVVKSTFLERLTIISFFILILSVVVVVADFFAHGPAQTITDLQTGKVVFHSTLVQDFMGQLPEILKALGLIAPPGVLIAPAIRKISGADEFGDD